MKTLFAAILAFAFAQLQAQITITDADMPDVDDTFRLSTVIDPAIDYAATGPNQTWDYSNLVALTQDIDTIFPVDNAPFVYQLLFDNSNLYPAHAADYIQRGQEFDLAGFVTFSDVYNFTKQDANASQMVGFGTKINGVPLPIQYDDIENVYEFPLDYGDSDSSDFSFGQAIPTIGYYGAEGTRYNEVDGWGTLITPFGTFQTIRVRANIQREDTLYIDLVGFGINIPRNTVEYKWLGAASGLPLLQINVNEVFGTETVSSIVYQDSARITTAFSIDELELESGVNVYPNPAQNQVTVDFTDVVTVRSIEVFDVQGRMVSFEKVNRSTKRELLDIANLREGMYYLRITAEEGVKATRIVIAR
jgi:hypothetical protein